MPQAKNIGANKDNGPLSCSCIIESKWNSVRCKNDKSQNKLKNKKLRNRFNRCKKRNLSTTID